MVDEPAQRRLTTILAADVAGYSRLASMDEEATLRTLKSYRAVTDRLIARHEGRIFGSAGDSVIAEFGSAVEAVRCAMTIQEELRIRNTELVADRRMLFRIGINVGDVLVEGENLLGDGVNVAARLEGVAEPGGICISGTTFDQVKNKLSIAFDNIGPQQVKNITEPIPAFQVRPGPVAVTTSANAPTTSGSAAPKERGRAKNYVLITGVGLFVALSAGLLWQHFPWPHTQVAALPENISTDAMNAAQIRTFISGMKIRGQRVIDGKPFLIKLNDDETADYQFAMTGEWHGPIYRETGRWNAGDFKFCMKFQAFAWGRKACPQIVKEGDEIYAVRRDGQRLAWSLSR